MGHCGKDQVHWCRITRARPAGRARRVVHAGLCQSRKAGDWWWHALSLASLDPAIGGSERQPRALAQVRRAARPGGQAAHSCCSDAGPWRCGRCAVTLACCVRWAQEKLEKEIAQVKKLKADLDEAKVRKGGLGV